MNVKWPHTQTNNELGGSHKSPNHMFDTTLNASLNIK